MKIKSKILFPMIALVVLSTMLLFFSAIYTFNFVLDEAANKRLNVALKSSEDQIEIFKVRSRASAIEISKNSILKSSIKANNRADLLEETKNLMNIAGVDIFTIADTNGIVLARTQSPDVYGDTILNQRNVRLALDGETTTSIEPGTVAKLGVKTAAPIYDNENIIGVVSVGYRLDVADFVDEIKRVSGNETTIFLGDTRISTTLTQDNVRLVGTKADPAVTKQVFAGTPYHGKIIFRGEKILTKYVPLYGHEEIIGMLMVGEFTKEDGERKMYFFLSATVIVFVIIVIISVFSSVISKKIETKLNNLIQDMVKNVATQTEERTNAENANKAKTAFLAMMSHEIRTPINAIMGITEIQLMEENLPPITKKAWEKIYNSGNLLLNIINDILDLSKIEANKLELLPMKYEVSNMISDTIQLNIARIGHKQIKFELNLDDNIPQHLIGDESRIKQILSNLLSNAVKYTSEGTVSLSIRTEESYGKTTLILIVSDTGQGITKEQQKELFKEYSRFNTESNRLIEGTGLGLRITNYLVQMMNGRISVESEPEVGSTFVVYLPQEKTDALVIGHELAEGLKQLRFNHSYNRRQQISYVKMPYGRVLIVDDVDSNLFVAKGLMSPYGLNIDTAASGFEAIEKIKDGKVYDIIFMDHMMPVMDGIETTKKIRDMGYSQTIIALTANALTGQAQVFLENGFDDFISKPVDIRQLNVKLNQYIKNKEHHEVVEKFVEENTETDYDMEINYEDFSPTLLALFAKDIKNSLPIFEETIIKIDNVNISEEDLKEFTVKAHAVKNVLANLGEEDLSKKSLDFELAGKDGNKAFIAENAQEFIEDLKSIIQKIEKEI